MYRRYQHDTCRYSFRCYPDAFRSWQRWGSCVWISGWGFFGHRVGGAWTTCPGRTRVCAACHSSAWQSHFPTSLPPSVAPRSAWSFSSTSNSRTRRMTTRCWNKRQPHCRASHLQRAWSTSSRRFWLTSDSHLIKGSWIGRRGWCHALYLRSWGWGRGGCGWWWWCARVSPSCRLLSCGWVLFIVIEYVT